MVIQVLIKVGALFFIMAIGAFARARKVITEQSLGSLCRVVLDVTLPFLFIYILSTQCTGDRIASLWYVPLMAIAVVMTGYAVSSAAAFLIKLPPSQKSIFTVIISFQNCGFLAIPIAFALFGAEGVLNMVVFSIGFNLLYWTFGVWLLTRSKRTAGMNPFRNLINPGIIGLALGLILGVFSVKLPGLFMDAARILGDATIPLAMLVVGAFLAGVGMKRKRIDFKFISAVVVCRLIIIPLIFLFLARNLGGLNQLMRSIIVLQACMPSASTAPLMAKRFGGDPDLAASGVFFTTLISIITIPVFMSLI